jgi:hypothetical protein
LGHLGRCHRLRGPLDLSSTRHFKAPINLFATAAPNASSVDLSPSTSGSNQRICVHKLTRRVNTPSFITEPALFQFAWLFYFPPC